MGHVCPFACWDYFEKKRESACTVGESFLNDFMV